MNKTPHFMVTSHPVFGRKGSPHIHTREGRTEMKNRKPSQEPSHNQNISEWIDYFLPATHFGSSFLENLRDVTERSKSSCLEFGSNVSSRDQSNLFFSVFHFVWSTNTVIHSGDNSQAFQGNYNFLSLPCMSTCINPSSSYHLDRNQPWVTSPLGCLKPAAVLTAVSCVHIVPSPFFPNGNRVEPFWEMYSRRECD